VGANCTVRSIQPEEWRHYRDLRLRALKDSPDAFGSTYAEAKRYSVSRWKSRVSGLSSETDLPLFAAHDGRLVGLAWGKFESPGEPAAHLFQMWVAPEARGLGIGRWLVESVIDWAKSNGARSLELAVTVGNTGARRLYESAGFEPVGDPVPLRPGSDLLEQNMVLDLT